MNHTPAPWVQADSQPLLVFRDSMGVIDTNSPVARCVNEVDARLISLAPEMLCLLRDVHSLIDDDQMRQRVGEMIINATT
ncbi:hypothetical protein [uncultured Paraglaciecola sp.]|uniref:hypothetical protein n=1 Tax=uncultured Paraglaciecola sp. TaxID=1765024 RepID=UPI0026051F23|nr:hypothetical protein [uncultured Paraglaciecola sp.]